MTSELATVHPFGPGTVNCGGCGMGIGMKLALEELGKQTILAMPACCAAVSTGPFPGSSVHIPVLLHAFETTGASLAGIRAALDIQGRSGTTVLGIAGDGGTFDIGLQALSGAAERNEDVVYLCYDNEAYMNTGIQRSSATPTGVWTTTTPAGKPNEHPKKDIVAIMAAHQIPYIATLSFAYPDDFRQKIRRAREAKGFRFLLMQSPCPTGWRADSKDTVRISRLGVEAGLFPLLEVIGGRDWQINYEPPFDGLDTYLDLQGRFSTMKPEQRVALAANIEREWRALRARVAAATV